MTNATNTLAKSQSVINRRSMLTRGAAVAALTATGGVSSAKAAKPVFAPTELGRELLRRFPEYVLAWTLDGAHDSKDRDINAAYETASARAREVWGAIAERPITSLSHLVDLAIGIRCFEFGSHDVDSHEAMVLWLLAQASIPESACNQDNLAFQHPEVTARGKARESVKAEAERIMAEAHARVEALEQAAMA